MFLEAAWRNYERERSLELNLDEEEGFSLERTFHFEGDITVSFIGALRSGWSKHGKTRLAAYG